MLRYWFVAHVAFVWQAPATSVNPLAQVRAAVLEQVRALLEQLTQVLAGDKKHQRSRSQEKLRREDALAVLRYWFVAHVAFVWQAPATRVKPLEQLRAAVLVQVAAFPEQVTQRFAGGPRRQ